MDSALKHQADAPTPSHSLPTQSNKTGSSLGCFQDTPSPPPSQSLTSPRPASQGSGLFDWPSNVPSMKQSPKLDLASGSTAQQHFHPEGVPASASRSSRDQSAASTSTDNSEDPPDSPLSQDSAYWSQSQPYKRPDYKKEEAVLQEDAALVSGLKDEHGRVSVTALRLSLLMGLPQETSLRWEPEQPVPPAEEADEKPKRLISKVGFACFRLNSSARFLN